MIACTSGRTASIRSRVSIASAISGRSVEMSGNRSVWIRRPIPNPSMPRYSAATSSPCRAKQSINASLAIRRPLSSDSPK